MQEPHIVTYVLMGVTILVSYLCFQNPDLFNRLKHNPYAEHRGEYYRLLTSGFVHGSWLHLGVNMFVFYSFGRFAEAEISSQGYFNFGFDPSVGHLIYLVLYLLTIVIANLGTFIDHRDNPSYSAIGASGAVSGATFCFVLFLPWEPIDLYAVLPIPSVIAGALFLAYSQYAANKGGDNIDHSAHFYGAIAMPALLMLLRPGLVSHFLQQLIGGLPF